MGRGVKDEVYVVQNDSFSVEYKVVYAGRSSKEAIHAASKHRSVIITIHQPNKVKE